MGISKWLFRGVGQVGRDQMGYGMKNVKAHVVCSVLGSAATVMTLASVVGAG